MGDCEAIHWGMGSPPVTTPSKRSDVSLLQQLLPSNSSYVRDGAWRALPYLCRNSDRFDLVHLLSEVAKSYLEHSDTLTSPTLTFLCITILSYITFQRSFPSLLSSQSLSPISHNQVLHFPSKRGPASQEYQPNN